jgi:3-deoxy-D-manno-octulosonic-acid transferase
MTLILLVYQLALLALIPFGLLFGGVKALTNPRYRTGWLERFGFWQGGQKGTIWVHGASMGEIRAAAPLVRALKERGVPLTLSATTEAGVAQATTLLDSDHPNGGAHYLPFDLIPCLILALRNRRPRALVIVETELWPGLLWLMRKRGVPTILLTARISERSYPRYRRIKSLVAWMLDGFESIQAQSATDAQRLLELGAPPEKVKVRGNMKFDLAPPDTADPVAALLKSVSADGLRIFVAGSVHPGEAGEVARGVKSLMDRGVELGFIVAPRHLEKLGEVESELAQAGLKTPVRWSSLEEGQEPRAAALANAMKAGRPVVVDGFGLLGSLYGGAAVSFVGGSLVEVGGHNLLEPLNWGVPVLFGPHMQNAPQIRDEIVARGLGQEVGGGGELTEKLASYLNDDARLAEISATAGHLFEANRGAVDAALEVLEKCGALAGTVVTSADTDTHPPEPPDAGNATKVGDS